MHESILFIPLLQNGAFFDNTNLDDIAAQGFHGFLGMLQQLLSEAQMPVLRQNRQIVELVSILPFLRKRHIANQFFLLE